MTERQAEYTVELLTPCFCHGSDCGRNPEIRTASMRGQIRDWRRMRGCEKHAIEDVWGGDKGGMKASKVALELTKTPPGRHHSEPLLPHKGKPKREAIPRETVFTVVLRRLVGCAGEYWREAKRDVETWLLLGCLGQRANRAAGSVWCTDWPFPAFDDIKAHLDMLHVPRSWDIRICTSDMTSEKARETASDTVENRRYFGTIKGNRIPSPVKMKVIRLGEAYRLMLTAASRDLLDGAVDCLKNKQDASRWGDLAFRNISA